MTKVAMQVGDAERRTADWDVQAAPKNYLTLITTQLGGSAAIFISVWVITRALGPSGYGRVTAEFAVAQIAMQLAIQWTASSIARFGVEEFVQDGKIARAFWSRAALLVPKLLLVTATAPFWFGTVTRWLHVEASALPFILLYLTVSSVWVHMQQALQAAKLPRLLGLLITSERLLILFSILILNALHRVTVEAVIATYSLAAILTTVVALVRLRKLLSPIEMPSYDISRAVRFSLPLIPFGIVGYLSTNQLDSIFILKFMPVSELGHYAVAYQVMGVFTQIPLLAGSLVLPFLVSLYVKGEERHIAGLFRDILPLFTLLWSACCLFAALLGFHLLPIAFGARFREAAPLLWPLMSVSAFAAPVLVGYFPLANAISKTSVMTINSLVRAIVNVFFDIVLIPRYGLLGCCWATVLASIGSLLSTVYLLRRDTKGSSAAVLTATLAPCAAALFATTSQTSAVVVGFLIIGIHAFLTRRSIRAALATLSKTRRGLIG